MNLTAKLLKAAYKSRVVKFKLVEEILHRQVYLILPDYAKNDTWDLFHACIDEHSQIFIY